ncbi:DEAD/DEAH box helicase [Carnobacterium funditum]|uniref:DEAD/DEAH box helicase n=1 Tax=Carnobacterium funditum TaxID=2752 RepID=UPI0005502D82|nr:DEAD/DEAH box helicase [Carnobacterium funditum]
MNEKIAPELQNYWEKLEYTIPSAIQNKVYEPMKAGRDVVGISPTGTGKTVAYTLPALEQIEPKAGVQLIILTPSQELAVQVASVVKEWSSQLGLEVQTIIGGANKVRQIDRLKKKPEIIVGTTGRILEIAETKKLKLHQVKTVILDEADQLLQQDQLKTVRQLMSKIPGERQMGFFSATSNELMEDLSKWFNVDPEWIDVTDEDESKGTVLHAYIETPTRKRVEIIRRLTRMEGFKALVFVNNVANLTLAFEKLQYEGISVAVLHAEKYKTERQHALQQFRDGKVDLLLTTDVASRGLDIRGLPYVIQYDLPMNKESYIHRSGRTARMGQAGTVLTLVNDRERREFKKIIQLLEITITPLYLYGGELVKERPEVEETPGHEARTKEKSKVKKVKIKAKKETHKSSEPTNSSAASQDNRGEQSAVPNKKKKHRKKPNKNKGARKPKKD